VSAIEVAHLHKRYGEVVAVHDLSFAIDHGEIVAVLGPNGAGKTTTIEILEGFRPRDGGTVHVLGHDPGARSADLRERVGVVLQHSEPEPFLTVIELLELFRGYYRRPRPTAELLEVVGLSHKASARIRKLSGGERRRLDLALALAGDPDLVFLDEPTTGFDPEARRDAWGTIRSLRDQGKTIVLTTHYLDEAAALADRVLVVARGKLLADAPPDALAGRDGRRWRVSFTAITGHEPADLPVPVAVDGARWVTEVDEPTRPLFALTAWAVQHHLELDDLVVSRTTLDDVYLELIA
jgi:ABC-2 type transport system ATP-binding protein